MRIVPALIRRPIAAALAVATAAAGFTGLAVVTATSASAAVPPVVQRPAAGVSADALPTAQVNGVVFTMDTQGNTVYAAGEFTKARPAGSALGQNEVTRSNLLSFDVTTGTLLPFAPSVNAKVKAVAVSPDGSRVYVAGSFTSVGGANRYRLAAFSTATGALISTFAPSINSTVTAIAVTNTTVYAGGWFSSVNGVGRTRLAAFNATNGALLSWAPTANADVDSMVLTPDSSKVVVGGKFATVNGAAAPGMGAVSASTGGTVPWLINTVVKNPGPSASIISLDADDTAVYGSAFSFGSGNYEGTFSANPANGAINWLDDCHGDAYDSTSMNGVIYNAGHAHHCLNIGGFPDTSPRIPHHSMAFTKTANGTAARNSQTGGHYANFEGNPAPSIIDWFPDYQVGDYTGTSQAAWSLTSTSQYLVAGGEFPAVNGRAQQGLVRFAVPSLSTNKIGPVLSGSSWVPTAAKNSTSMTVTWPYNHDPDDLSLSYSVLRSDKGSTPVYTVAGNSTFWQRPSRSFVDTNYAPSTSYTYTVRAVDPSGNARTSAGVTIVSPPTGGMPQNPPPVAAFSATSTGLSASFNASASTDNGSISADQWNYGDGTTGSGVTSSHTYAAAGTYQVTLTVTDNQGATGQLIKAVTLGSGDVPAADTFTRTLSGTWGTADAGGPWTLSGGSSFSVAGNAGRINLATAGSGPSAVLNGVTETDVDIVIDAAVDKVTTGSGAQVNLMARKSGSTDYRLKLRFLSTGKVNLVLSKVVSGAETSLREVGVTGLVYAAGSVVHVRFQITGSGTASLSGKAWLDGTAEPGAAQATAVDTEATLQDAGSVGVQGYLTGSVTNAPIAVRVDNFRVT